MVSALLAITAAVLVAAAGPRAAAASAALGPLCVDIAQSMGIAPSLVDSFASQLPEPPGADFCSWLTENQTQADACDFLALMHFGLTGGMDFSPITCPNATVPQAPAPPGGLTALRDARPLPAVFPNPTAMFEEEGASFHWLFVTHTNVLAYSACADQPGAELALSPGWRFSVVGNLSQAEGPDLPFLYLLQNDDTNQAVLVVRSTLTNWEWSLDFRFNQTSGAQVEAIFGTGAAMQSGFYSIFIQAWPAAKAALELLTAEAESPDGTIEKGAFPELWVVGHSMGSAVGKMLAYASQRYLLEKVGEKRAPLINGVFFAPPQFSTKEFSALYNELMNSRDVDFKTDLVSQVPCVPEMPACPANTSGVLALLGVQGMPTDQGGATSWPYDSTGGSLPFTTADMPQDTSTWEQLQTMPLCWAGQYLTAAHACSYTCYTSAFVPGGVEQDLCWLSQKPAGQSGSQCYGFPNAWLGGGAVEPAPAPELAPGGAPAPEAPEGLAPSPAPAAEAAPPVEAPPAVPAVSGAARSGASFGLTAALALLAAAALAA